MRQTIIWTNEGLVYWHMYVCLMDPIGVTSMQKSAFLCQFVSLECKMYLWYLSYTCFKCIPHGCGLRGFLRWCPLSTMWAGPFNLFMATTRDVWLIPSFRIWDYVLHVEHVSCAITNCGQHQWILPSPFSISLLALLEENTTRKLLSLSLDLFFKILLFQVAFFIFFSIGIFSPYFLVVGLLLQSVVLFQSRELVKYLK